MMAKWSQAFLAGFVFAVSCLSFPPLLAQGATWVPIQGNIRLANGTPICAMVLANGQYMFSCDGTGAYDLHVPLDANGQITLFAFADGFAPFRIITGPGGFPFDITMEAAAPDSPLIGVTRAVECADNDWIRVSGEIESFGGEPLCAMVLANGQHMFTCDDTLGRYDLRVPVDENGQVTVFGFADGFQPYTDIFWACPSCNDNATDTSFGEFVFNAAGNDSTARCFVEQCGFTISGTHNGGYGDTLQVIGCGDGVELVWAFEKFSAYRVSSGWTGQTDRGVRIGQSREVVLSLDPRLATGSTELKADFGSDGVLNELIVGRYFKR